MIARKLAIFCSASTLALLGACVAGPPHNEPVAEAPLVMSHGSPYGRVSNIETMSVASRTTGGGAVVGALLGAVIGHQIGSGSGRTVATGVGAVGGAVIGNSVEQRNRNDAEIYRVSVRMDNGGFAQFDYQRIDDLRVGDRVKVENGQIYRD
jgi:outer membrane lipoprotein SlyB